MAKTVIEVFNEVVANHGDKPALKVKRDGEWQTLTWKEYSDLAKQVAKGFMKLGLEPGSGVSIIGFNCPEWLMADVGAILAGGVPAGIYTTNSAEQCQYITDHCEAVVAVVENVEQLAKFKAVRDQLPTLKAIVMIEGSDDADDVFSWDELLAMGDEVSDSLLEVRMDAQKPEELCTLIYTSGTTGPPKAVMMSHNNFTWTARMLTDNFQGFPEDQNLSYLPLSHVAEQVVTVHLPMMFGSCTYFAESLEKLGENLAEVRPSIFFAVPRVWEKIQAKMTAVGAQNSWLKKKIAKWARKKGLKGGYAIQRGEKLPAFYGLANKLVFSKVRDKLGLNNARVCVTSAAPISLDTLEFFLSLGIPILEVYGMSESTGPAVINTPDKYMTGSCGYAVPDTELKIAEDGEICMKGPHVFMGYFKNEEATKEALEPEGWLHSGDVGELDEDGFLRITDRKKDLIITAGGENIAPQLIEGFIKSIPAVGQAVVIGDKRKYLAALLTIDPEQFDEEVIASGSEAKDLESAAKCDVFKEYLQKQLDDVNERLARVQTIKKFAVLANDFTIEGGELTPTMKVKRKVVNEKYAAEIEGLY